MKIVYTKSYDNSIKNLKKHYKELEELNRILKYLKYKNTFEEIQNDSVAKMYGFERLKHQYNEFYSFRLSKIMRLIVKPHEDKIKIYLIYVSKEHYEDFNLEKVKYYDE